MASNRIKGITIEIDGNTTPLTKSLKDVDKSLKSTQDQLKDVNKLLKLDPGNTELLRQKQELLTKAISDTKARQEELKKALEQAQAAGDTEESRKQQDLLQRELIETTQKLNSMEAELKDMGEESKDAGEAMEQGAKGASKFGEAVAAKLTSAAIIAGVKKLASALKDVALGATKAADELNTQAQVTGLSTDALQEYAYMSGLVDVSVDTITGSLTKLTKSMSAASKGSGDAYDAFRRLGVSATNLDGSLRDNEDVFNDLIDALAGVQNETERDTIAMTLFGKSAKELNPLIKTGSKQLKAYAKEAHDVGYVMDRDVIKKNVAASDAIDRLKKAAEATKNEIGSALAPVITKLATGLQNMLTWAQKNSDTLKAVAQIVGIAAAAFLSYKAIVLALEIPTKAAAAAQTLLNGAMVANPIIAVTTAMAALFIVLDKFSKQTYSIGDDVIAMRDEIDLLTDSVNDNAASWDAVVEAQSRQTQNTEAEFSYYEELAQELSGIVDKNGKVKEGYEARAEVITGILSKALDTEIEMTDGVIKNYKDLTKSIDDLLKKKKAELIMQSQEEAYTRALQSRQQAALDLISAEKKRAEAAELHSRKQSELTALELERQKIEKGGINEYNDFYYNQLRARIDAKQKEVDELKKAADDADAAYNTSKQVVNDATYNIQLYEQNLAAVTRGEYDKIITANADVARSYSGLDTESKKAMDAITGNTASLGADLYASAKQAGEDFMNGFIKGIDNKTPSVKSTVASAANTSKKVFKYNLDEKSPSKATAEMGEFFIEGFEIGLKDEQDTLFKQIASLGRNALLAFSTASKDGFSVPGINSLTGGFGATYGAAAASSLMSAQGAGVASGGVNVSVVVNGNVENYDALAETIGQKLQQQMAREGRAFA